MTRTAFLARYPEFDPSDGDVKFVDSVLAEMLARLDAGTFGDRLDEAHGALTAHELWASPFGVTMRGEREPTDSSIYLDHYHAIKKAVTVPLTMMVI